MASRTRLLKISKQRVHSRSTTTKTSLSSLPKWPKPFYICNGDYRNEAFLEHHIGGPLYAHQDTLPRLPVPALEDTIRALLPTAIPLAESEEEVQSFIKAVEEFQTDAIPLQKRLMKRKEEMGNSSWLQLWWNQLGYLQVRDPVVINVSYYFQLEDDDTLPQPDADSKDRQVQVARGAAILTAVAEYRKRVCSGSMPVESIGRNPSTTPLCSTAFKYMFHSCRIPREKADEYKIYDPSHYRHCIVAVKGQFFVMDFVNDQDDPLPISVLERGLQRCLDLAMENEEQWHKDLQLGILTGRNRDTWALDRAQLKKVGGVEMESALHRLESGAILLCLDDESPIHRDDCAQIYWNGGRHSGSNRWFDKSIQIMVQKNGKAGYMGEHSMMDGMPAVGLCSHIISTKYERLKSEEKSMTKVVNNSVSKSSFLVEPLFGGVWSKIDSSSDVKGMVARAQCELSKFARKYQLKSLSFQAFGSDYIKKAGFSPDAFVQMAMQLASYRIFGRQVGTYEASQTRPFLHGRTETTRSVSLESSNFVKTMGLTPDNGGSLSSRETKIKLLRTATESHSSYLKKAAQGSGIDRHLFGLSMLADENGKTLSLLQHPLYQRSKTWRLSTSTLPHNPGFGPVVSDGVGLAYTITAQCCFFTLTAIIENGPCLNSFHDQLENALLEMKSLVDCDERGIPKSKL